MIKMEYKMIVELRAVFDDSDIMTDYFNRDRPLEEWFVMDLPGKRVSEKKLRSALNRLPNYLKSLSWEYRKGEKYSMSDHYYSQLRADYNCGFTVSKPVSSYYSDIPLRFVLTVSSLGGYEMNNSVDKPIPNTREDMQEFINKRHIEAKVRLDKAKQHMRKVTPQIIRESSAIIDGSGFRVLTDEDKESQIIELKHKWEEDDINKRATEIFKQIKDTRELKTQEDFEEALRESRVRATNRVRELKGSNTSIDSKQVFHNGLYQ